MMIWVLDEDNGFSVKFMFEALRPPNQLSFLGDCVWNPAIQSKVAFLL